MGARPGDDSSGVGVDGSSDELYVNGPVLCGFVDTGAGNDAGFGGSMSPFVVGFVSRGAMCPFPFVDAFELLSPYEALGIPFCI